MTDLPPPLSAQLATIRTAVSAAPAHALIPASLHALIIAMLVRLFTRLEDMLRLWQAGTLPPLPAPRPRLTGLTAAPSPLRPSPFRPSPPGARTPRVPQIRIRSSHPVAPEPAPPRSLPAPPPPPPSERHRAAQPPSRQTLRPRSARAPPESPATRPEPPERRSHTRVLIVAK